MRYVLSIAVIVGVTSLGTVVGACTCGQILTAEQEYALADAVFSARVVSIEQPNDEVALVVVVSVFDCWKGSLASEVVVRTASTDALCGFDFQYDVDYLLYARSHGGELYTDLCMRNGPLESAWAQSDIEIFGEPAGCTVAIESTPWTMIKKLFASER